MNGGTAMDLQYPIGKFEWQGSLSDDGRHRAIDAIEATPAKLREAVRGLSGEQLDTPYRPGGWTVRQVIHHLPDSHINSYVRFKLALTEDAPLVKPYDEKKWADLEDTKRTPVETSLVLLDALHARFVNLLRAMTREDFQRTFRHPELGIVTLERNVALYAWHGPHHVAQIVSLRERMGW